MGDILVGTASWTDKALIASGRFYPPEVRTPEERLRFYARQFPVVGVDSSYYALPNAHNSNLWVERTAPSFVFDVKAFRLFTQHQTPPEALPKDIGEALAPIGKKNVYYRDLPAELREELWRRSVAGIDPLRQAGRLGVVLFQFPPWFIPSRASFAHLLDCQDHLPGFQLAVQCRNRTWLAPGRSAEVLAFEREHGLAHVVVDEPQGFASSVPALWEVTCPDVAVVRLHGRNAETWERKGLQSSGARFNYLYGAHELEGLTRDVRTLAAKARRTHVLFNNNYGDYAQRNAADFQRLMRSELGRQ
jgi:uncharacterized protein YecE (DUF72 family)